MLWVDRNELMARQYDIQRHKHSYRSVLFNVAPCINIPGEYATFIASRIRSRSDTPQFLI